MSSASSSSVSVLGSVSRPLQGDSPLQLGEAAAQVLWPQGEAVWFGDDVWELWIGGWRRVKAERVEKMVLDWLPTVHYRSGDNSVTRFQGGDRRTAADTVWAMQRHLMIPQEEAGVFMGTAPEGVDRRWCVACHDKLVEVRETGELNVMERPRDWFDTGVAQTGWGGECPVYDRVVKEWSMGDAQWVELMERACGLALTRYRGYQRWMLLEGRIRGGKGTILRLMKAMMGEDYWGTTPSSLAGEFGLQGTQYARVIGCGEAVDLDGPGTSKLTGVLKGTVGGDETVVNGKHIKQERRTLGAMVFICANGVPKLENKGGGLSGKMLVLPFKRSFLGEENLELDGQLRGELGGVLKRWLEAAGRLRCSHPSQRWPVPLRAQEVAKEFREEANTFQAFLEAHFVQRPEGFTESGIVWDLWRAWRKEHRCEDVPKTWLTRRLINESEWHLERRKSNGLTYLGGCSLKAEGQD